MADVFISAEAAGQKGKVRAPRRNNAARLLAANPTSGNRSFLIGQMNNAVQIESER